MFRVFWRYCINVLIVKLLKRVCLIRAGGTSIQLLNTLR